MGWGASFLSWLAGPIVQSSGEQIVGPSVRSTPLTRPEVGAQGAMQISAFWACVEILTDTISTLPCFVYRNLKDGKRELARKTMLWTLFHESPNARHTPIEFWAVMAMQYLLRGNAYARLERKPENGEVVQMWPLMSDQMKVIAGPNQSLMYEYTMDGIVTVYSERSIMHWRDKGNGMVGLSRLSYMQASLGVALDAQDQAAHTHAREGRRPGVFMIDKLLTEPQREQIRKNFAGLKEKGEDDLLILEAGAKWEPVSLTPAEVQLIESRRFSIEDIARWFGVPSVLINDTQKTTTWGTGVGQIIEGFVKFKLRPTMEGLEQALAKRVLTTAQRIEFEVEFSMDALLRSNLADRSKIYATLVQNGLKTRNECRQLENDPPLPGGDQLLVQVNLVPIDSLTGGDPNVPSKPVAQ